jgi:hypothetical protein
LILGNVGLASASSRTEAVDELADWIFYRANPELNGRKLSSDDTDYSNEWYAIWRVLDREAKYEMDCNRDMVLSAFDHMTRNSASNYANPVLHHVADSILHHRNGTSGRITEANSAAALQWWQIRRAISVSDPCD